MKLSGHGKMAAVSLGLMLASFAAGAQREPSQHVRSVSGGKQALEMVFVLDEVRGDLPVTLSQLVDQCLSHAAASRPTADSIAAALASFRAEQLPESPAVAHEERVAAPARTRIQ